MTEWDWLPAAVCAAGVVFALVFFFLLRDWPK